MTLEELNRHFVLMENYRKAKEKYQRLIEQAYPGAANMDGMPRSPQPGDKVGSLAIQIADEGAIVDRLLIAAEESEKRVRNWVNQINDPIVRNAFRFRFILCKSWSETAEAMGGQTTESVKKMCYRFLYRSHISL